MILVTPENKDWSYDKWVEQLESTIEHPKEVPMIFYKNPKLKKDPKDGIAYVSPIKANFEVKSIKFRLLLLCAALIPWKTTLNITINKGAVFINPPQNE